MNLEYPVVMGILNLTPDSFSDGGKFVNPLHAAEKTLDMVEDGAQIIDLGGESTRPGSNPVSEQEEIDRIGPVLEPLPEGEFVISIDTTKRNVAQFALQNGAHMINDVSGGNPELLEIAKANGAGFVLMHSKGSPKNMQDQPSYSNAVQEIRHFFLSKKAILQEMKLPKVWIDPGIGFGKALPHNLELMRCIDQFADEAWGILLGSSRKSWIDHLCQAPDPLDRLGGSLASAIHAVKRGVEIVRVHDVRETVQALQVAKELASLEKTR
ncbi:MAG: dihydropteroate synthase [Verrucomicrobia bacterium TMED56]|nr:MAG: dihydropteroate synthase [Verrucomicrobia bacterium TMED56]